jgi:four helix bundle protein
MGEFHFRKLHVYRLTLMICAHLYRSTRVSPIAARPIVTQLIRASSSIALNIAEGAGEYRPAEKARFYRIARRSAAETAAALDLLIAIKAVPAEAAERCHRGLDQVGAMLTSLAKNQESRHDAGEPATNKHPKNRNAGTRGRNQEATKNEE